MDKKKPIAKVSFNELASEFVSSELRSYSEQVEIHVQSLPKILIMLNRGYVSLTVNLRFSAKKLLVWVSTLGGFAWAVIKVITEYWPTIESLIVK